MGWLRFPFWNARERRPRAVWRLGVQFSLFMIGTGLVGALASLTLIARVAADEAALGRQLDPNTVGGLLGRAIAESWWFGPLTSLGTLLVALLVLMFAGVALDRRPLSEFGFHFGRSWWLDLAFGLLLGVGLMALIFAFEAAVGWVVIGRTLVTRESGTDFVLALAGSLVTFLCVGIYEEMLSRGYQLRNVAEGLAWSWWSPRAALLAGWVLSSLFFGLLHANNPNATPTSTVFLMLAGLFLGLGFILTGELAIPIGLHITWNFFEGNVFGFPVSGTTVEASFFGIEQRGPALLTGGAFGPEGGIIGLVALIVGSAAIWLWVRRTRGSATPRSELAAYSPPERALRTRPGG
jgi:uncharacterized protein